MATEKSSAPAHPSTEEHKHQDHRLCVCNSGWVSLEVETEDGGVEEVLYLCRRCRGEERT